MKREIRAKDTKFFAKEIANTVFYGMSKFELDVRFHKNDVYDHPDANNGWIHNDEIDFAGLVYLNIEEPSMDTGTSIFDKVSEGVFEVQDFLPVRIIVEEGNWYVFSEDHGRIFSFDIPPELFEMYDQWSDLSPHSIYSIKTRFLTAIRIIATRDERLRIITLELDQEWLEGVRARLAIVKRYKEKG